MTAPQKALDEERSAAQDFVASNLHELCRELVALDDTGLFGTGKAHELRKMCSFSGSSAQSLCIGMVNQAALRHVASQSPVVAIKASPAATHRIGGSILPSNEPRILKPWETLHGTFHVRPLPELDTHGLYLDKRLLVTHPNGFSCHGLAERLMQVWGGQRPVEYALEQFDYILTCGGLGIQRAAIESIANPKKD